MESSQCNLCLVEEGASQLTSLIDQEGIDQQQQPDNIPTSIWRHRQWFLMCVLCFTELLRNGPPRDPENLEDDSNEGQNQDTFAWADLDLTPLTNEQENLFWGDFRQQRLDDFVQELAQMLSENAPNTVTLDALVDTFSDSDFWNDLETQWNDEIDEIIRAATSD